MNKRKIGWFCTYTPIEVIEAAGLMPYGIRSNSGKAHEDVYLGDAMCSYVRSCLGSAVSGDYDFLDGVVIAHSCECMSRLYDGWEFSKADIKPACLHLLDVPRIATDRSIDFYASEIERFKESLEAVYGNISRQSIDEAITESAYTSKLLAVIHDTRKRNNPPVTGVQMQEIMMKGMVVPRKSFNTELLTILNNPDPNRSHHGKPRIMVHGGPADSKLIETIEKVGGIVVCEHMCNGLRQVRTKGEHEDNPFRYLARSYLSKTPCPRMIADQNTNGMLAIRKMADDYRVDGIIYFSMKFCANAQALWPLFKDMISRDMPLKLLEGDASEDMNIREVESFVRKLARRSRKNGTGTEG